MMMINLLTCDLSYEERERDANRDDEPPLRGQSEAHVGGGLLKCVMMTMCTSVQVRGPLRKMSSLIDTAGLDSLERGNAILRGE